MSIKWTESLDLRLTLMWSLGRHAREIAAEISRISGQPCTRNSVIGRAHRLRLAKHDHSAPTYDPKTDKKIVRDYRRGRYVSEISSTYKVSFQRVYAVVRKAGIPRRRLPAYG